MRINQQRLIVSPNWELTYYGYDGGGSVRQLFNPAGAVTDTYAYDTFGNTVARTGSTLNEFQYRGEQFDSTLGMYNLRARYYVPRTGRFLTQDTDTGVLGRPVTQHKYIYAYNDAVGFSDPSGHGFFERAQLLVLAIVTSPVIQHVGEEARGALSLGVSSVLRASYYFDILLEYNPIRAQMTKVCRQPVNQRDAGAHCARSS